MTALKTLKSLQSQPIVLAKGFTLQIKELARAKGVDVGTIRYYEKQGMLPEPARRDNGYRDSAAEHLERLSFIRHYRALDMPLGDINRLLGFTDARSAHCSDVDLLVDDQLGRVRTRLKRMRALEKQLLQLRVRCSGMHEGHCGILDELVSAAHGEACVCHSGLRHVNDRKLLITGHCLPKRERHQWVDCSHSQHTYRAKPLQHAVLPPTPFSTSITLPG